MTRSEPDAAQAVSLTDVHALLSGRRRGSAASLLRGALAVASVGYGLAVRARNLAWDRGWRRPHRAQAPVISVGNLTTGGTGKTPLVAWLADWFTERGVRVTLLSRGYRSLEDSENDEKRLLEGLCPQVPHLQNPDRIASAERAVREHRAQLLLLDDGFQHRRLARDVDVVLIDALNPWGYNHLLPRGLLREPVQGLKRADVVILTRTDQVDDVARTAIVQRIAGIRGSDECVQVAYRPGGLVNTAGGTTRLEEFAGRRIAAFCGIGNPDGFRRTLQTAGCAVAEEGFLAFPDHHHYTPADLSEIGRRARSLNVDAVLTTQKDLVKLTATSLGEIPLWAVSIGTQIVAGEQMLQRRLSAILERIPGTVEQTAGDNKR